MQNQFINQADLNQICEKYQVDFLGIFGSRSRDDFSDNSDLDLLVKFHPNDKGGLFKLVRMRDELEMITKKKVDLLTEGFLSKYFKDEVLSEVKPIYVRTQ